MYDFFTKWTLNFGNSFISCKIRIQCSWYQQKLMKDFSICLQPTDRAQRMHKKCFVSDTSKASDFIKLWFTHG